MKDEDRDRDQHTIYEIAGWYFGLYDQTFTKNWIGFGSLALSVNGNVYHTCIHTYYSKMSGSGIG